MDKLSQEIEQLKIEVAKLFFEVERYKLYLEPYPMVPRNYGRQVDSRVKVCYH